MSEYPDPRDRMIHMLERRCTLDEAARVAVRALVIDVRSLASSTYLIREGQRPRRCAFLLEGYTYRQKLAIDGNRSIVALQVPGDFIDLQNLFLDESDHDVQLLTSSVVADIAIPDLQSLVGAHSCINNGLWATSLIEASIGREWLLSIGRRDARARLSHLLCEISSRAEAVGPAPEPTYALPMTQEQIGDALGLTAVHVNRVLKGLVADGLITRRKREVTIADWDGLRHAADFNERYLHLRNRVAA